MKAMFKVVNLIAAGLCCFVASAADFSREIAEVKGGARTEANASWWGFKADDATECLQAAIDSGVKKLIVDNTGSEWLIRPITLRSNQEIVFAAGVTVRAKPGEFKAPRSYLFNAVNIANLTLRGESGAVLKMNKADYLNPKLYPRSEWRHLLNLESCENVTIKDLTLQSSGGDGIYLGRDFSYRGLNRCRNVIIDNVICADNNRQGLSIISVEKLLIRNSKFITTRGANPQAGIDFEPNRADEVLIDCVLENCDFAANAGNGVDIYLPNLTSASLPVSISFRRCRFVDDGQFGVGITTFNPKTGAHSIGNIEFSDCLWAGKGKTLINISGQPKNGMHLNFKNSTLQPAPGNQPLELVNKMTEKMENINFENFTVDGWTAGVNDVLRFVTFSGYGIGNLTGDITVRQTTGKAELLSAATLAKLHPDNAEIIHFKAAVPPVLTELVPVGKEGSTCLQDVFFRGHTEFLQYASANDKVPLLFRVIPLGHDKIKVPVEISTPDGNVIARLELTQKETKYVFIPDHTGVYRFVVRAERTHKVGIESGAAGHGFAVGNNPGLFRCGGRFYFQVPAGIAVVTVKVRTEKGETVDAALLDQQNKLAAKMKRIDGVKILKAVRPDTSRPEIWSIEFTNAVEDYSFSLGAGLTAVVAGNAKNLLITK